VNRQHDDHTWFVLFGERWKIYGYRDGLAQLWRVDRNGRYWYAIVDFGSMDIEGYVEDAVWLLEGHWNVHAGEDQELTVR
jgi:hypothetical protein